MKVGYFGLPLGAYLLMRDGHELDPCVLSPLAAPGRRRVTRQLAPESLLDALDSPRHALNARIEQALARAKPDLIVSWFWTRLLPAAWLNAAPWGGVGVHPSLLPRHRGPNPYFWSIDSGDRETGVTLHTLAPEYDTGAILLQRALTVGERNSWQLARALDRPSLSLLREGVGRFARSHPPTPTTQDEQAATWAPEPTGRELSVDWSWPTARILRRIRAISPVPGLAVEVAELRFFVTRAEPAGDFVHALEPGEAAVVGRPGTLVIRTGDGAIAVERALLDQGDESIAENDGLDAEPSTLDRHELAEAVALRVGRAPSA
ncbi:MAG TPA: formyltransferase family protein [Polyangiaceae bacterium]|nr:formyltransferase family protein [Polyangiaceae bacterium]HYQ26888.1 formyltransferase family protein [Polyangiaceae bacterium]